MPTSTTERPLTALEVDQLGLGELAERQAKAEIEAAQDFMCACAKCDANALADFAPRVTDWGKTRMADEPIPKRMPTLAEIMVEALDYRNGPCMAELMQLVLIIASGTNLAKSMQAHEQARDLLARMAATWAEHNVTVEG